MHYKLFSFLTNFFLLLVLCLPAPVRGQEDTLRVGLAGSAPFVIRDGQHYSGISVDVWDAIASDAGIPYRPVPVKNISEALDMLTADELDLVAGPVSITSERAESVRFTQPYFLTGLVIASRSEGLGIWKRIKPFFSLSFFVAVCVFLLILAIVGTLIWLSERKVSPDQFPPDPLHGIGNGLWLALVTMTTVGYGDKAPKTLMGRIISGLWMIITLVMATSLVAGIASTLTVSSLSTSEIRGAEDLKRKRVGVLKGSPAEDFVSEYQGIPVTVDNLGAAFDALEAGRVKAVVYDKPQIQHYLRENPDRDYELSQSEYMPQGYGLALAQDSPLITRLNVALLRLDEDGRIRQIEQEWLGDN